MANGIAGGEGAMKRPEEVTLSREDGEALIERLEKEALTAEDRRVLQGADVLFLIARPQLQECT
jgi:hypothetical protein